MLVYWNVVGSVKIAVENLHCQKAVSNCGKSLKVHQTETAANAIQLRIPANTFEGNGLRCRFISMGRRSRASRFLNWFILGMISIVLEYLIFFLQKAVTLVFGKIGMFLNFLPQNLLMIPLSFLLSATLIHFDQMHEPFGFIFAARFAAFVFPFAYTVHNLFGRWKALAGEEFEEIAESNGETFYRSKRWQTVRYKFLKAAEKKCVLCGTVRGPFHVDHIKPRSKYPHLALDTNNLQVLCAPCNLGKGTDDVGNTDFRQKRA